jgi:hypothetical protein
MKRPKHFIPLLEPAAVDQRHDRAEVLNYDLELVSIWKNMVRSKISGVPMV